MLKYLLDTNICIYTIKNKPQELREAFHHYYGQFAISSITLMELIYGAEKSANPENNLVVIDGFSARLEVHNYGFDAPAHTSQISAEPAGKETPIGPYDAMLAGHARSAGLILVTTGNEQCP